MRVLHSDICGMGSSETRVARTRLQSLTSSGGLQARHPLCHLAASPLALEFVFPSTSDGPRSSTVRFLAPRNRRIEAQAATCWHAIIQLALSAVYGDKPDCRGYQTQMKGDITDGHRALQNQAQSTPSMLLELTGQFDIDRHGTLYRVSNTESSSESGTSKVTLCGGRALPSCMYSGMRWSADVSPLAG